MASCRINSGIVVEDKVGNYHQGLFGETVGGYSEEYVLMIK